MRCIVLGCGTSTGVPIPGCRCAVCTSGDPKNFRDRTSALIQTNKGLNILIDASTDLRHQALKWDVQRVDAVFFTHAHADHTSGLDDLRSFNFVSRTKIPCYGTKRTLDEIRHRYDYVFASNPHYEGGMLPQLELIEIEYEKPFILAEEKVVAVEVLHGQLSVAALRISGLAYVTDCKVIPENSKKYLTDAEYLLLDGLQYELHKTHLDIPAAIEYARELNARRTYLIHMTHTVDYATTNAQLPESIELAYDGLAFDFQ